MKEELGTWGAVVGAVVLACLFGGLVLAIYPGWPVIVKALPVQAPPFDFINFFAAVGSCGAAVVALWIALRQNSQKRRDEELKAQLVAASISVRLSRFHLRLANLAQLLGFDSIDSGHPYDEDFASLQKWFKAGIYKPTDNEIAALVTLPNQAANRMARGYEVLHVLAERVEAGSVLERLFHRAGDKQKLTILNGLQDELLTAEQMISIAKNECIQAAKVGAPYPSADEIYG